MQGWMLVAVGAGFGAAFTAVLAAMPGRRAGGRARTPSSEPRLTAQWTLAELDRPSVVCVDLAGVALPAGATVLASGRVEAAALRASQVRRVAAVPAEFAIDAAGQRGLLFLGGVRPGAWAWPTSDPAVLGRLRAEVEALAAKATPYAERRRVADLAGGPGLPVEAEGTVREVLRRDGAALLRLEDDGATAAVRIAHAGPELVGQRVRVRGRLARDASGYAVVDADEVSPLP